MQWVKVSRSRQERAISNQPFREGLTKEMVFKLKLEASVKVYKAKRISGKGGQQDQRQRE